MLRDLVERGVTTLVHCGDWTSVSLLELIAQSQIPTLGVLGNNDPYDLVDATEPWPHVRLETDSLIFTIDGVTIGLTHGHDSRLLKALYDNPKIQAVFSGHTHEPAIEHQNNQLLLNPGTCGGRQKSINGPSASYALFETTTQQAEIIEIESGKVNGKSY